MPFLNARFPDVGSGNEREANVDSNIEERERFWSIGSGCDKLDRDWWRYILLICQSISTFSMMAFICQSSISNASCARILCIFLRFSLLNSFESSPKKNLACFSLWDLILSRKFDLESTRVSSRGLSWSKVKKILFSFVRGYRSLEVREAKRFGEINLF
jgi:hypothetical protein